MALNGVIKRFKTGDYTVTRRAAETYVAGIRTPAGGFPTTFSIEASIQPVTGRDLRSLPEGQHADDTKIVFTVTELKTRSPSSEPDVITYKGEPWQVIRVEDWEHWGSTHYRCMMARRSNP